MVKMMHDVKKIINPHASANSSIPPCTHIRLTMFPIYVLDVQENWPDRGIARKIVDIDTAIHIMSSQPEFKSFLKMDITLYRLWKGDQHKLKKELLLKVKGK